MNKNSLEYFVAHCLLPMTIILLIGSALASYFGVYNTFRHLFEFIFIVSMLLPFTLFFISMTLTLICNHIALNKDKMILGYLYILVVMFYFDSSCGSHTLPWVAFALGIALPVPLSFLAIVKLYPGKWT